MTIYAIGDVQGCFQELTKLLKLINFDSAKDTLWFTGDLVNRGPQSLEVLRFIKSLGDKQRTVLGNHDLHLIALAYGFAKPHHSDTLTPILTAPDRDELINWLREQPLFIHDQETNFVMAHAGLAPNWTLEIAKKCAAEVETVLRGSSPEDFLQHMYGNQPDYWDDHLTGVDRLRSITNYFTRLRLCHPDGRIDFSYKGALSDKPADLIPWYEITPRANAELKIIFGHWAALEGKASVSSVFPLDTGCVWGRSLTAMRLSDQQLLQVNCGS